MSREGKTIKCLWDFNKSSHPTLNARRMMLSDVVQSGDHDLSLWCWYNVPKTKHTSE
jgi:hypothetical protein